MRRECDRLSKARRRVAESECEALVRREQNKASLAKKRASESESEASLLDCLTVCKKVLDCWTVLYFGF